MEQKDTKAVQELINTYLKQFNLAPVMDEEEVAHWFLPRDHIIDTYVVEVKHALTTSWMCMWMPLTKIRISIKFLKCGQYEKCVL